MNDTAERVRAKLQIDGECWLWTGALNNGFPIFNVQYEPRVRTHPARVLLEADGGVLPDGQVIFINRCGNKRCVRPGHHEVGTQRQLPRWDREKRAAEFWERVDRTNEHGCWPWTGGRSSRGYGSTHWAGSPVGAHRLAYMLTHGEIPDGMYVCHRCDNPPCVNPAHLFLGEPAVNSADMKQKGRVKQGDRSKNTKLTPDQVRTLRERYAAGGVSTHQLAKEYGVGAMTVWNAIKRNSHKDVE